MKRLALGFLAPIWAMASHTVDVGGFYTVHKEKGYRYDLGGLALSYEIGNSKGLKARGKILTSNNSDLLFVQAHNELLWYIPLQNIHLIPFTGAHVTHHNVLKNGPSYGVLTRIFMPLGIGVQHRLGEIAYEIRAAHLHPLGSHYIYDEGTPDFWGRRYSLPHSYLADAKITFLTSDKIHASLLGRWVGDYAQKIQDFGFEAYLSFLF